MYGPNLARRLRELADDSERLAVARAVPPIRLQTAPLLEDWVPVLTAQGVHLVGQASGHPLLGDRRVITSPLWFADPAGSWVRSLSRFYRLGPPADGEDVRRIQGPKFASGEDRSVGEN